MVCLDNDLTCSGGGSGGVSYGIYAIVSGNPSYSFGVTLDAWNNPENTSYTDGSAGIGGEGGFSPGNSGTSGTTGGEGTTNF